MLVFLKLGGSLITDKDRPYTARRDVIARIAQEVKSAIQQRPDLRILLGHGSGSFGHFAARNYGTRERVTTAREWQGFQKVWYAAQALNRIVIDEFVQAELPAIALPASSALSTDNRKPQIWNTQPIQSALENGLLPIVFGDVIFDRSLGGIIYSTEELFVELLNTLQPNQILLAGKEAGVWKDYPRNTEIVAVIDPAFFQDAKSSIAQSASVDVTGGMAAKVELMLKIVKKHAQITARVFSGEEPGNILKALTGAEIGTLIRS